MQRSVAPSNQSTDFQGLQLEHLTGQPFITRLFHIFEKLNGPKPKGFFRPKLKKPEVEVVTLMLQCFASKICRGLFKICRERAV